MPDTKPVLIRLELAEHTEFKKACDDRGESMQLVGNRLLNAYSQHHNDRSVRHMTGEKCPLYVLIEALSATTRKELENR